MPLSPEEDTALRRQINREIDDDLERRRTHQPPRDHHDEAATHAVEQQRQVADRKWVEQFIDAKLSVFAKAVGQAIARYQAETLERVKEGIVAAAEMGREPQPAETTAELIELPATPRSAT